MRMLATLGIAACLTAVARADESQPGAREAIETALDQAVDRALDQALRAIPCVSPQVRPVPHLFPRTGTQGGDPRRAQVELVSR